MATKLKPATEELVHISDLANAWDVDEKTIKNYAGYVYQAFDILLSAAGPFPQWGAELINLTAKHISGKASLYTAETGETRRLKATEYVKKIRAMRSEGHFSEYDQFRQLQNLQNFQPQESAGDLEDEASSELGNLTRQIDQEVSQVKQAISAYEDKAVEEVAEFINNRPQRMMSGLTRRLQSLKPAGGSVSDAIDVAYKRLPSA